MRTKLKKCTQIELDNVKQMTFDDYLIVADKLGALEREICTIGNEMLTIDYEMMVRIVSNHVANEYIMEEYEADRLKRAFDRSKCWVNVSLQPEIITKEIDAISDIVFGDQKPSTKTMVG